MKDTVWNIGICSFGFDGLNRNGVPTGLCDARTWLVCEECNVNFQGLTGSKTTIGRVALDGASFAANLSHVRTLEGLGSTVRGAFI